MANSSKTKAALDELDDARDALGHHKRMWVLRWLLTLPGITSIVLGGVLNGLRVINGDATFGMVFLGVVSLIVVAVWMLNTRDNDGDRHSPRHPVRRVTLAERAYRDALDDEGAEVG